MRITLLIMAIILMATSCPNKKDGRFKVKNNSPRAIYYDVNCFHKNDTALTLSYEEFKGNDGVLKVLPGNTNIYRTPGYNNWDCFFSEEKDTIYVHILDANVIENIDYEKVRKDYMVLKRYKVTLKDIQTKPITITYNGEIQNFKKRK